jgi:hypothetical protein
LDTKGIISKLLPSRLYIMLLAYLVFFFLCLFFVLLTLPSLFSYPFSYPLHVPCFSCAIIHSFSSQVLVLLLFINSWLIFASRYYPSPTCHHITPPSYTLTTHWLAYCTKHTHHWPLQYLSQAPSSITVEIHLNTLTGHKTQQTLYSFSHPPPLFPTFLVPPLLISQIPICRLIIITTPQIPLFMDIITKVFSI